MVYFKVQDATRPYWDTDWNAISLEVILKVYRRYLIMNRKVDVKLGDKPWPDDGDDDSPPNLILWLAEMSGIIRFNPVGILVMSVS